MIALHNKPASIQAIVYVCIAWFSYSVADALAKMLAQRYSFAEILTISSFVGLVFTGLWILKGRGWRGFLSKKIKLHMARAVSNAIVTVSLVPALGLIPMADFYGIVFMAPLIVLILLSVIMKEKVGWRRWTAVAAGFCGVLILAGPQYHTLNTGILLAMIGAFFIAVNIVLIRRIGTGEYIPVYGFYAFLMIFITNFTIMLWSEDLRVPSFEDMILFASHAPFVLAGQIFFALGFSRAPEASVVTPFHYTQMIWGILFGYFLFGSIPSVTTLSGIVIIAAAGLYVIFREYQIAHRPQNSK